MSCSTCKHWEFPTLSIYQGLATKGVCSKLKIADGTPPDGNCERYEFEEKSPEFKRAVDMATQALSIKKMGDEMNKEATVEDVRKEIDKLAESTSFTQTGDKPATQRPGEENAKYGDKVYVHYTELMEYVASNNDDQGNTIEVVFKKPDGKLLIVGANECNLRKPN